MNLWQTCLEALTEVWPSIKYLIGLLWVRPEDAKNHDMNADEPITPPITISPPNPDALLPWTTIDNCRHNCRAIADLEGLTTAQKNTMSKVIHCESNFNIKCIHPNVVNGKIASTDYSICQVNDFWHIGPGKDFPSVDYVMNNPEAVVRWMCKMVKNGQLKLWVCYQKGLYENYTS